MGSSYVQERSCKRNMCNLTKQNVGGSMFLVSQKVIRVVVIVITTRTAVVGCQLPLESPEPKEAFGKINLLEGV